ncbi:hypothetical protein BH10BAC1_BH10BAC1_08050 [soil metagenome]
MKTDEHVRQFFQDLPENYFLFIINPNNGSNTNGHVIYLVYKEVKSRYPDVEIYYVVDKDGISEKTVALYFTQVLKLPFTELESKKTIVSKELYKQVGGSSMSKLIYIYHKEPFYDKPFKYSHPNTLFFPKDILKIVDVEKIKLDSNKHLNTNLNDFINCGDKIIQIADVNNRVAIINPVNGAYENVFDKSSLSPEFLYEKFITKSKTKINFMKNGMKWFDENNREQLPIYNAVWDNGTIYLFMGLQVLEKLNKEKLVSDGLNGQKKMLEGETIANLYHFVIQCDEKLNVVKVFPFKSFELKGVDFLDAAPDIAMYCEGNSLYCFNSIECDITEEVVVSEYYKGISLYKFVKDELIFDSIEKIPFVEEYDKKGNILVNGCIIAWNEHIFVIYNTSPFIYSHLYDRPVGKLHGFSDLENEVKRDSYTKNLLDETPIYITWEYIASSLVFNKSYFVIIYKHHGKPFLEIKNHRMITVQIIKLVNFPEFRQGNVVFLNEAFYVWSFENDDFFFYKYSLDLL